MVGASHNGLFWILLILIKIIVSINFLALFDINLIRWTFHILIRYLLDYWYILNNCSSSFGSSCLFEFLATGIALIVTTLRSLWWLAQSSFGSLSRYCWLLNIAFALWFLSIRVDIRWILILMRLVWVCVVVWRHYLTFPRSWPPCLQITCDLLSICAIIVILLKFLAVMAGIYSARSCTHTVCASTRFMRPVIVTLKRWCRFCSKFLTRQGSYL